MKSPMRYKRPESVLVVIYARASGRVLMLQRRDDVQFWQSVTGSMEEGELPLHTALREVREETGIDILGEKLNLLDCHRCIEFKLFTQFLSRYAPGITHNKEHWFCLGLAQERCLTITEHNAYQWVNAASAVRLTKSWSNRLAIEEFIICSQRD